jgi:hypothetical protein
MGVIIVREMVGTSSHSWSDAARQAVALASKTVRNIRTVEVVQSTARVEGGEIVEYHGRSRRLRSAALNRAIPSRASIASRRTAGIAT